MAGVFSYQDPTASIGASLGRALFGDPEAARALAETKAKMDMMAANAEESRAHAGLYGTQADDQRLRTQYRGSFGDLARDLAIASGLAPTAAPAAPVVAADPGAPIPAPAEAPTAPTFNPQGFKSGIVPLIAALAGTQENPNIRDTIGAFGAMLGDDETARRALIAQGQTPGKEFALTPERADDIAKQGYDADYSKSVAVARTNHANDIPVANINADADRYGADVKATTAEAVARIRKTAAAAKADDPKPVSSATINLVARLVKQAVKGRAEPDGETDQSKAHLTSALVRRATQHAQAGLSAPEAVARAMAEAFPPHAQPAGAPDTPSTASLRRWAKISIGKGADPDAVAKRFKELTGEDL